MTRQIFIAAREGDDRGTGACEDPLASLEEAVAQAKKMVAEDPGCNIEILFQEGIHYIAKTVVIGSEFCRNTGSLTLGAATQSQPVLSAGQPLAFQPCQSLPPGLAGQGKIWEAHLPENLSEIKSLFTLSGRCIPRCKSASFKAEGEDLKEVLDLVPSFNPRRDEDRPSLRRMPIPAGAVRQGPYIQNGEVFFAAAPWGLSILPIHYVDEENSLLHTAIEGTLPIYFRCTADSWVENLAEDLSSGTWCCVRELGKVYYWPEGPEPESDIIAPGLVEMIRIEGDLSFDGLRDEPIRNIHFRGLTFSHGERYSRRAEDKGYGIQHDWEYYDRPTALLRFRSSENCSVRSCRFTNSGGTALRFDLHCQQAVIENNLIDYVGHMGILLCGYGPGLKNVNKKNLIRNNLIHHTGTIIEHGHAIFIWQSGGNLIAHNKIHHVPRKAIGLNGVRIPMLEEPEVFWDDSSRTIRWQEILENQAQTGDKIGRYLPFLHTVNNRVEYNEVYRALEKLGDGAAINVSGAGEGNFISKNYIHHLKTLTSSAAFRTDDWQRGTTFHSNIIYMSNVPAFARKNFNHIENNIIVDVKCRSFVRFASYPDEEPHYGSRLHCNIFYESGTLLEPYAMGYMVSPGASKPEDCDLDRNLFFCKGKEDHGLAKLREWQTKGIDQASIIADPQFTEPAAGNFTPQNREALEQIAFQPFSLHDVGLEADFPQDFLAFDYEEKERPEDYHRGYDLSKERPEYKFW